MVRLYEPQVGSRLNAMLVGVLSPVWRQGDSYQFEEDLTAWDTRITEYERDSGNMVDPEVRMAVITQHAPQSIRQVVLQAAAQVGGVYTRFREIILTYLQTDKHFTSDGHGGPQPMDVGAIGKGKNGKKGDGKKGDGKKGDGEKVDGKGGKNNVAGKGKGQGTQKFDGNCTARSMGTWQETVVRKKRTRHKSRKTWVLLTNPLCSRPKSVGAVALISSTTAGSGLGRLVMAISDQGEKVDSYQVLDGTRPEVVVMMAVDSGSEVHTAPVTFPWNVEQFDKTSICLSDVQGNKLKVYGTALSNYGVHDVGGNVIEIGTRFLVSDTVKFVLSVGELGRHGWNTTLGTMPCLSHEAGCQVPLMRKGNTFYLSARLGFYGEAPWKMVAMTSAESATPSPSGRELGSSSASRALLPPLAEALPVPMDAVPEDVPLRPVLSAWSPVGALRDRLKALNGPTYGTKDELWKRLCEYVARAEQQLRERQWIEARQNELIQGARPHEAEILDAPSKPEDPMVIERHDVTHIPPMPWCLACRLGKGREAAQIQIDLFPP